MTRLDDQPEVGTGDLHLDLVRRLTAEAFGTGILVVAVIGSGIAASRLSTGDVGLQLLENALATAAALVGLILMFGAVSGAHFNPVVTLLDRALGVDDDRDRIGVVDEARDVVVADVHCGPGSSGWPDGTLPVPSAPSRGSSVR